MNMRQLGILCVTAALACAPAASARAEVIESTPNGFIVRHVAALNASPAKVYDAIVDVAKWWDPAHSYSGKAANMSIDARAGGCFCERLDKEGSGGSVQHLTVVFAAPGEMLRMRGGLGPLQDSGASGALTFALAEKDGKTELTMTYVVGGYFKGGLQGVAAPVDAVLGGQLERLKKSVGQ